MKTMTCKQLGGACDEEFHANTFQEMAELSKKHGMEMFQNNDAAHMTAMQEMMTLMQDTKKMQEWMAKKKDEFDAMEET